MGELAFVIVQIRKNFDQWETVTPLAVIQDPQAFDNVLKAVDCNETKIRYAVESVAWDQTQPYERVRAEIACQYLKSAGQEYAFKTKAYKELCEQSHAIVADAIERRQRPREK